LPDEILSVDVRGIRHPTVDRYAHIRQPCRPLAHLRTKQVGEKTRRNNVTAISKRPELIDADLLI
jgi:hypothetical protein